MTEKLPEKVHFPKQGKWKYEDDVVSLDKIYSLVKSGHYQFKVTN